MADREPYKWITVKGKHIPVYKDEHGQDVFGVGSDTKKRVDQKDLTNKRIQEELLGKDSYVFTPEYQELSKQTVEVFDKMKEAQQKRRELGEQLDAESKLKPKDEWDTADEIEDLLGFKPTKYTEKGEKIREEYQRWNELENEYTKQWDKLTDRIKEVDKIHAEKSRAEWLQSTTPEKISRELKDDYYGFEKARSTVPYIDDKLESGDAFIWSMSPKAYIQEAAYNIFDNSSVEKVIRGRDAKDVAKYMTMMEQGVKFHTPYLNYKDKEQEGLHRAIAAYMLGLEEIPVIIVPPRGRRL